MKRWQAAGDAVKLLLFLSGSVSAQTSSIHDAAKGMIGLGVGLGVGMLIMAAVAAYYFWQRCKDALHQQQAVAKPQDGQLSSYDGSKPQELRSHIAGAFDSVIVAKKRQSGAHKVSVSAAGDDPDMFSEQVHIQANTDGLSGSCSTAESPRSSRIRMVGFKGESTDGQVTNKRIRGTNVRNSVEISCYKTSHEDDSVDMLPGSICSTEGAAVAYYQQQLNHLQQSGIGIASGPSSKVGFLLDGDGAAGAGVRAAVALPGELANEHNSSSEDSKKVQFGVAKVVLCAGGGPTDDECLLPGSSSSQQLPAAATAAAATDAAAGHGSRLRRGDDTARVEGPAANTKGV